MTTFYICRHGLTENNQKECFSGWVDTPLTEQGLHDAEAVAAKLQGITIDRLVSSDLGRAFITAYIVTRELGITFEIERMRDLREVNYGDFANQPYSTYPNMTPEENAEYASPNGENLIQMQQRVLACITALSAASPDQSVLVVAHDGTINAIRGSFLNQNMGIADLTKNAHDFVGKFTVDNGKITSFEELSTK